MPLTDLVRFAFAERNHAVGVVRAAEFVFHFFDQDLHRLTDFRWVFVCVPLVEWDGSLTLEPDVDESRIVIDTNDLSVDDAIQCEASFSFNMLFDGLLNANSGFFKGGFQFCVVFQAANKVPIDHGF